MLLPSPPSSAPLCPALAFTEAVFGFSCQAFACILQHRPTAGRNRLLQEYSRFPLSRGVFPLQVYLHQTCHKEKDPVPALTLLLTRQTSSSCLQDKGKAFPGIASGGFGCPLLVFKSRHCHWRRQTSTALLPGGEGYPWVNPAVRQKIRVTFPKKGKKNLWASKLEMHQQARQGQWQKECPKQTGQVKGAFVKTSHPTPGKREETPNVQNCGRRELSACRCALSIGK